MRRVGADWRVAVLPAILAGWCAFGGAEARVECAGVAAAVVALLLIVATTPACSRRRRFGLVAHRLLTLTAGVALSLGAPVRGYQSVGEFLVFIVVGPFLEGPVRRLQRVGKPAWERIRPVLYFMFGEPDPPSIGPTVPRGEALSAPKTERNAG